MLNFSKNFDFGLAGCGRIVAGLLLILVLVSPVKADRYILYFTASWCPNCPSVTQLLRTPEIKQLRGQYKNTFILDVDQYKQLSKDYKIATIPQVVLVETDSDGKNTKILEKWTPAKPTPLKDLLRKFIPKRLTIR